MNVAGLLRARGYLGVAFPACASCQEVVHQVTLQDNSLASVVGLGHLNESCQDVAHQIYSQWFNVFMIEKPITPLRILLKREMNASAFLFIKQKNQNRA